MTMNKNNYNFTYDLGFANKYLDTLFYNLPDFFGVIVLGCIIFISFLIILYMDANVNLERIHRDRHKDEQNNNKPIIDYRCAEIKRSTTVLDDIQKIRYDLPNTCVFFYDHLDRSGISIVGSLVSVKARLTTVIVDGVPTTGYKLRGVPHGAIPKSRLVKLDNVWFTNKGITHRLFSTGLPLNNLGEKAIILSSAPDVTSVINENNLDFRQRINYIIS